MKSELHGNSSSMDIDREELFDNEASNETKEDGQINKQTVEEPKLHMVFDSTDEIYEYYRKYAAQIGFGIAKRSTQKNSGELRYFTVACHKFGQPRRNSKISLKPHPVIKVGCKAKLGDRLSEDGKWGVTALELNYNHSVSLSKSRFHRCNRHVTNYIKRKLELNNDAGIPMNKSYNSLRVEYGENEIPYLRKDCENYIANLKRLRLSKGGANALQTYFTKVQSTYSNFFYAIDIDDDNRIRNLFWADSRSRAAYEEFGDVVTFDTTYMTNKYDMPSSPFVGVNHHGQSILLGCGLISNEDTKTFVWLFDTWHSCMSKKPPCAIITYQDGAMKNAIEIVFPSTRHRWCLWHIMKKVPEKLRGCSKYESIKFSLHNVVYDSLTTNDFEFEWKEMIEKYDLESNE